MNRWLVMAVVIGLLLGGGMAWLRAWPMINIVETGRTPEYPDIQPRFYQASPGRVFDAALHAVHAMPRWVLVASRENEGEIRAESTTRLMRFVDDVVVRITSDGGKTRVDVRSASRVGRGDFGQNARSIRAFFVELDTQLGTPAAH